MEKRKGLLGLPLIGGLIYATSTVAIISIVFLLVVKLGWSDRLFPTNLEPLVALAILFWCAMVPMMYVLAVDYLPRSTAHGSLIVYQAVRWWCFFMAVLQNEPLQILLAWSIEMIMFLLGSLILLLGLFYQGLVSCKRQLEIEIKDAS